ncbi:MAG: molybdopterin-dependent oxidoreductase [Chloroflexota bacterium]|nr:molybdopterin-dependent oxidoreductase [Chloroflexota bacterium]
MLGAVIFAGCRIPEREFLAESPVLIPEDLVEGQDAYYATLVRPSTGVESVLVRVMEGRAKKIEGNPDYPLSRGKHTAQAEASLQELYHPDRIATPLRLVAGEERGSGQYEEISWEAALDELEVKLREYSDSPTSVAMITEPLRGALGTVVERFASNYGATQLTFEAVDQTVVRAVFKQMFNQDRLPVFDVKNAHYVLSFGADFLSTWHAPLHYNWQYGEFRGTDSSQRGTLVQIEPRFSMTAANADTWVPINPGTEGVLALAIADEIVKKGIGNPTAMASLGMIISTQALPIATSAELTGVSEDKIVEMAHDFVEHQPAIAIGGGLAAAQTNGSFNMTAVYLLNALVDNIGKKGGILFNPEAPLKDVTSNAAATPFIEFQRFADRMRANSVKAVLVHGADPVHGIPGAVQFRRSMKENVEFVASFSNFMDETTALADLILPDMVPMECWGDDVSDPGPGYEAIALQQPVVMPFVDVRCFGDVLLATAEGLGGGMPRGLPWNNMKEAIRANSEALYRLNRGSIQQYPSFEEFWVGVLQRGGWWDIKATSKDSTSAKIDKISGDPVPTFSGDFGEYPFHLLPFLSHSMGDGSDAHLPWLQATPDPITTAVWSTWVELNPQTAKGLDVKEGDILDVISPKGTIEAQVYVNPATPPNVVSIPMGQGHTFMGRYAEGIGSNVMNIVDAMSDANTGALAWGATRVKLKLTGRRKRVPKFEGMVVPRLLDPDIGNSGPRTPGGRLYKISNGKDH